MSALQDALENCDRFDTVRETAIACSHPDYIDAPNAYALNLIKKCGCSADFDSVYEHGFTELYDEIFDRTNDSSGAESAPL